MRVASSKSILRLIKASPTSWIQYEPKIIEVDQARSHRLTQKLMTLTLLPRFLMPIKKLSGLISQWMKLWEWIYLIREIWSKLWENEQGYRMGRWMNELFERQDSWVVGWGPYYTSIVIAFCTKPSNKRDSSLVIWNHKIIVYCSLYSPFSHRLHYLWKNRLAFTPLWVIKPTLAALRKMSTNKGAAGHLIIVSIPLKYERPLLQINWGSL